LPSPAAAQGIVLRGIAPQGEVRVTDLAKNIKSGRLAHLEAPERVAASGTSAAEPTVGTSDPTRPGIILGKELSMRLGAFVGDTINVVSPVGPMSAIGMTPKIRVFRVVGVLESGMYASDSSVA